MKIRSETLLKVLASAVLLTLVSLVANAQTGPSGAPSGPVQIISNAQFNQMVQSGQLKVISPAALLNQAWLRLRTDLKNKAVVDEYMRRNPNLPGFAQLVAAIPHNPNVFPTVAGTFRTQLPNTQGVLQTFELNGQEAKLAQLASSIQASSDPGRQLALYQLFYSQYTAFYSQICDHRHQPHQLQRSQRLRKPDCAGRVDEPGHARERAALSDSNCPPDAGLSGAQCHQDGASVLQRPSGLQCGDWRKSGGR